MQHFYMCYKRLDFEKKKRYKVPAGQVLQLEAPIGA